MNNRTRRSAKDIVSQYTNEVLNRQNDDKKQIKLDVLATISSRMGWMDIFNRIKNKQINQGDQWWQK